MGSRVRQPWDAGLRLSNPKGVASTAVGVMNNDTWWRCVTAPEAGRNPFRVATNEQLAPARRPLPRVAEYGNPGLIDATLFGVACNHFVVEKNHFVVEKRLKRVKARSSRVRLIWL